MKIISLGLGVQSTALYYMSRMGKLPRCDYAIFSDTGREKKKTIAYLHYLKNWQDQNNGIPIIIANKRNLYKDLLGWSNATGNRFASIPAFTKNDDGTTGMLRRQCTNEYKIYQVDKIIRELYGLLPRQRTPQTEIWKGITLDEIERMSIPQQAWKIEAYPFIQYITGKKFTAQKIDWGLRMTRNDVVNWYNVHGLPIPPKIKLHILPLSI